LQGGGYCIISCGMLHWCTNHGLYLKHRALKDHIIHTSLHLRFSPLPSQARSAAKYSTSASFDPTHPLLSQSDPSPPSHPAHSQIHGPHASQTPNLSPSPQTSLFTSKHQPLTGQNTFSRRRYCQHLQQSRCVEGIQATSWFMRVALSVTFFLSLKRFRLARP
jgi:hypothetical protein